MVAMTTTSQLVGLPGYTPLRMPFCRAGRRPLKHAGGPRASGLPAHAHRDPPPCAAVALPQLPALVVLGTQTAANPASHALHLSGAGARETTPHTPTLMRIKRFFQELIPER